MIIIIKKQKHAQTFSLFYRGLRFFELDKLKTKNSFLYPKFTKTKPDFYHIKLMKDFIYLFQNLIIKL
jgi:hypothetical protein